MGKGKILLLGQDEVNLAMTEMILSEFDYEVSTATDGEEAVRLLTESRHDLLLIDVIMQPMNGIEILERIREIPGLRDINTIFLTASSPRMLILRKHSAKHLRHMSIMRISTLMRSAKRTPLPMTPAPHRRTPSASGL